ncbi:hypothetical protein ACO22_06481 [Paracoccidioides brasiliensis]|uniref:Uncharacterized protein n=1 Tax=Paracoccidioides brasiliensis TaxID=121759 RepID=A0A1D2J7B8_PARBR|nr:hypothetical protein ACO22_06481 [Paracoccidioides brasiliensis]
MALGNNLKGAIGDIEPRNQSRQEDQLTGREAWLRIGDIFSQKLNGLLVHAIHQGTAITALTSPVTLDTRHECQSVLRSSRFTTPPD